jgi:hypothetical protein
MGMGVDQHMPTVTITHREIERHHPDLLLPPDEEFRHDYSQRIWLGGEAASQKAIAFVAICRNAMPFLPRTLRDIEKTGLKFKDFRVYIFENDSEDGTKDYLSSLKSPWLVVESQDNGRPHLNYTKTADRTVALAEYRNRCREWVREKYPEADYVCVFDTDPWGGFSADGILNTVSRLEEPQYRDAAGMASYSWCVWGPPVWPEPVVCQYDAWAFRFNHWRENHDMRWFHFWHPPVGSPPVKCNSAFGQLAVYRTRNYLRGVYEGGDCEHVSHWRTAGGDCYLNPSQRVTSFWIPLNEQEATDDGLREDLRGNVVGRDADPDHCRNAEDIG